jgi:hypothetical protein
MDGMTVVEENSIPGRRAKRAAPTFHRACYEGRGVEVKRFAGFLCTLPFDPLDGMLRSMFGLSGKVMATTPCVPTPQHSTLGVPTTVYIELSENWRITSLLFLFKQPIKQNIMHCLPKLHGRGCQPQGFLVGFPISKVLLHFLI